MKLPRRKFLHLAAGAVALPAVSRIARAQTYPSRPVRIIVPLAAWRRDDIVARLMGQWLSERLGQPFIVDNRPGAGGNIGTEAVVRAPPDGYTLLLVARQTRLTRRSTTSSTSISSAISRRSPASSASPYVMVVHPSVPARPFPSSSPTPRPIRARSTMASAASARAPHVAGELFKMMTGVDMVHVPYRGGGPALTDLLGGQVQVLFGPMPASIEHIRSRQAARVRGDERDALGGAAGRPDRGRFRAGLRGEPVVSASAHPRTRLTEIIDKLNKEINAGLADPKMKARLADLGGAPLAGSPADFGKLIADETEKWGKVIKFAGIKPE